jgi:hypothetical protein
MEELFCFTASVMASLDEKTFDQIRQAIRELAVSISLIT